MHRSPAKAMSSTSSLVLSLIGMNSDLPQNQTFVALATNETTEFWRWALERGVAARLSKYEASQFYDVNFDEFAADPIAMVKNIYTHFNLNFSTDLEDQMRSFAAVNARGRRFGYHDYNESQLFLNAQKVNDQFFRVSPFASLESAEHDPQPK